jgi:hypothetical protein
MQNSFQCIFYGNSCDTFGDTACEQMEMTSPICVHALHYVLRIHEGIDT